MNDPKNLPPGAIAEVLDRSVRVSTPKDTDVVNPEQLALMRSLAKAGIHIDFQPRRA
jgi:hypothetical protein